MNSYKLMNTHTVASILSTLILMLQLITPLSNVRLHFIFSVYFHWVLSINSNESEFKFGYQYTPTTLLSGLLNVLRKKSNVTRKCCLFVDLQMYYLDDVVIQYNVIYCGGL